MPPLRGSKRSQGSPQRLDPLAPPAEAADAAEVLLEAALLGQRLDREVDLELAADGLAARAADARLRHDLQPGRRDRPAAPLARAPRLFHVAPPLRDRRALPRG